MRLQRSVSHPVDPAARETAGAAEEIYSAAATVNGQGTHATNICLHSSNLTDRKTEPQTQTDWTACRNQMFVARAFPASTAGPASRVSSAGPPLRQRCSESLPGVAAKRGCGIVGPAMIGSNVPAAFDPSASTLVGKSRETVHVHTVSLAVQGYRSNGRYGTIFDA